MSKLYLKENSSYKNYPLNALTILNEDESSSNPYYTLPLGHEGILSKLKREGVTAFKGSINSTTPIKYITQLRLLLTPSKTNPGYTYYVYTITDDIILNNNFKMCIYSKSVSTTGTSSYISGNKVVEALDNVRCSFQVINNVKAINIYVHHRTDLTKIYLFLTLVCY